MVNLEDKPAYESPHGYLTPAVAPIPAWNLCRGRYVRGYRAR